MNVQKLIARRDKVVACAAVILDRLDRESRSMTPDEDIEYSELVGQAEELNRQIENPTARKGSGDPNAPIPTDEILSLSEPQSSRIPSVVAALPRSNLKAFSNNPAGREAAYRSAQWIRATLLQDGGAFQWCKANGIMPDVMAAHSGGVNTAGGALVPEELSSAIIRLVEDFGVFRSESRVITLGSDTQNIARRRGGLTANFIGEGAEGSESDSSWDNVGLHPKKLMVLSRLSSELSEDSLISMIDLLAEECALALATKEDQCGFVGDGTSTYGGMQGLVYRFENETLAGAVDATAATTPLIGTLPVYAQANAKWYCSSMTFATALLPIAATAGGVTIAEMSAGVGPNFLGYPVVLTSTLPSTGTLDAKVMLLFGDLRLASTMGVRRELRFQTSQERYWTTDEIGVRCTERFDINNHDLGDATTAGPVLGLMGNT